MTTDLTLPFLKKWTIAVRPWSLPASTMPVIFGSVMAAVIGGATFKPLLFLLSLIAMVILHCGANILSDINDYRRGLDTMVTPVSGAVVRGLITPPQALRAAIILLTAGGSLGLLLALFTTPLLLAVGALGLVVGVLYTRGGPLALKYHALGDLAVFLNFGILGSLGAWMVQTGGFSWMPMIWSTPMALLVIGILHANNWRDIETDTAGGIITVASLLGDRGSLAYYAGLLAVPFLWIGVLMFVPATESNPAAMPMSFLLVLLSLPRAITLFSKALARRNPRAPMDFVALDGATAQLNLMFGALCTASLLVHALTGCFR